MGFNRFFQGPPLRLSMSLNSQMSLSLWLTAFEWVPSNEGSCRDLYVKLLTKLQHQGVRTCAHMLRCERAFYREKCGEVK